ncbi:IPT/TIG domain-containing protein [uncultured Alistipes sp.]|jgi:putative IPT/TIG domain protein|uniref:IPT/TIG domain-containing protein n=1 Tax=uncultured Alistipes sp. TaxID=538949 RepID=UPI00260009E5|nr:IPT/TIG domain-containing protein [uncultured Alistipes sp.]
MKRIINHIYAVAAGTVLLFAASCDKTHVNETPAAAPVIESFTPHSAPVGAEIIITGQNLNAVTKAYIGDVEMIIKEKVSDTRMSIVAGADGRDGKISLVNVTGKGESAETFTYSYAVPELKAALLPASADMGDRILLPGNYLSAVEAVLFTADGYTDSHEGTIVERSATELLVRVPYVESSTVSITMRYYNGTTSVTTPLESAPTVTINRYKPQFDAVTLQRTAVGRTVTLTGTQLDKVNRILVGRPGEEGFEAVVSKQPTTLTFTVPAGDFEDGDTTTEIIAEYFDGYETYKISDDFVVYVPFLMFWEGMQTYGRDRAAESQSSFFSPQTGRVYHNSDWRTLVDPVCYESGGKSCSAKNTPNKGTGGISEAQYRSANPYFFISGVSAGNLQINGPANSDSQLRNFYMTPSGGGDAARITGATGSWWGTPVLKFRFLDPGNPVEKAIADKVKNQTLEKIDEEAFPIDVTEKTVGGVGITSAAGALSSNDWAAGLFTVGVEALNVNVDAVIMVLYYNYNGSPDGGNPAENILRVGFLHIRTVNFKMMGTGTEPSGSDFTFNCYWQKYDYDYSKIP